MLKPLMKKRVIEQQYAVAPPALRPALKKEYEKVVNNIGSKFTASMKVIPNKQAPMHAGTGKYAPLPTVSLLPPQMVHVSGKKRSWQIVG